jgi:TonB family protein
MTSKNRTVGIVAWALLTPWIAAGQPQAPGTPPDLDRRVFVDVNQVTPSRLLDQLCDTIACTLDVDAKLPQPDISLRLSNVRARTALDAVCDMVGCRWTLRGRTLVVTATTPPPAVPQGQQWAARMRNPLTGAKWNLDRVPLRDVLAWLSQELGAEVIFDGPDGGTLVTEDLRGRVLMDAIQRVLSATGYSHSGTTMGLNPGSGRQEIRLQGRKEPEAGPPSRRPPGRVYEMNEPGLTMPRVISEVRPSYTRDAMRARIEGWVSLTAVVEPDGSVGDVKVIRSLSPDLDAEAISAAKRWQFEPGRKDGKPVPVVVAIELTFTLKK